MVKLGIKEVKKAVAIVRSDQNQASYYTGYVELLKKWRGEPFLMMIPEARVLISQCLDELEAV